MAIEIEITSIVAKLAEDCLLTCNGVSAFDRAEAEKILTESINEYVNEQLDEVAKQHEDFMQQVCKAYGGKIIAADIPAVIKTLVADRQRVAADLRGLLQRYGGHDKNCDHYTSKHEVTGCSCGFGKVLAGV